MAPTTTSSQSARLQNGVYVPTVAFFRPATATAGEDADEIDGAPVDVEATQRHAVHLAEAGVAGLVVHGSNGEAVHLAREERAQIIQATRAALDEADHHSLPVIAGCGAQSTREATQLCRDAAAAGASHALILPPAYYGGLLDTAKIVRFFHDVAAASPIPILVYNYPGACAGLDLSSDAIVDIARHPNVRGVKLTCGNTGKLARIADALAPADSDDDSGFFVAGGSADFILQSLVVGAHGTIAGTANLCPRVCVRVCELFERGELREARRVQAVLAKADWVCIRTGFAGVKAALQTYAGYGGEPRQPCTLPDEETRRMIKDGFKEVMALERELAAKGGQ